MKLSRLGVKIKEDEALMRLVVKGNENAFEELVDRHMHAVFRFAYSLLHDKGKAEDVTQETFTILWQRAESWQPTGKVRSWLFRIARNKSIDEMRSVKIFLDVEKQNLLDSGKSPVSQMFDHEVSNIIDDTIAKLPKRQSEAIMLVYFLEASNIEAAEVMDVSVDALESLLARGRKKLREFLGNNRDVLLREDNDE